MWGNLLRRRVKIFVLWKFSQQICRANIKVVKRFAGDVKGFNPAKHEDISYLILTPLYILKVVKNIFKLLIMLYPLPQEATGELLRYGSVALPDMPRRRETFATFSGLETTELWWESEAFCLAAEILIIFHFLFNKKRGKVINGTIGLLLVRAHRSTYSTYLNYNESWKFQQF